MATRPSLIYNTQIFSNAVSDQMTPFMRHKHWHVSIGINLFIKQTAELISGFEFSSFESTVIRLLGHFGRARHFFSLETPYSEISDVFWLFEWFWYFTFQAKKKTPKNPQKTGFLNVFDKRQILWIGKARYVAIAKILYKTKTSKINYHKSTILNLKIKYYLHSHRYYLDRYHWR